MIRKFAILAIFLLSANSIAQEHKAPPVTRVDNVTETLHGVTITDPYRWLEDQNSPETRAWINAQNRHTSSVLGSLPFRNRIHERLTQLLKIDAIGLPSARGGVNLRRNRVNRRAGPLDFRPDFLPMLLLDCLTHPGKRLHHDAWVNGATDPISGMVTVMEVGRALGELLKQGWKPKRTIILCGWDGEEPALLGSTEWVETHADELKQKAVAYINSDSNGKGWLSAGGSHSLERLLNEVARDVMQPDTKDSVWQAVKKRRLERASGDADKKELNQRVDLRIDPLGSGSDYTPFLQHLGIASLNTGFGGDRGGGVYHSVYDSFAWYTRFGDPTFEHGRALAQVNGTLLMRLANADVLPFEFTNLADTIGRFVDEVSGLAQSSKPPKEIDLSSLKSAVKTLSDGARRYEDALGKATATTFKSVKQIKSLNQLLYQSERKLTSDQGLPRRPWFKHQIYAPGFYTGYGVKTLPGVREAIEQKHWEEVGAEIKRTSAAIYAIAAQIDAAARMLEGK